VPEAVAACSGDGPCPHSNPGGIVHRFIFAAHVLLAAACMNGYWVLGCEVRPVAPPSATQPKGTPLLTRFDCHIEVGRSSVLVSVIFVAVAPALDDKGC
jgi:hypothetical protein